MTQPLPLTRADIEGLPGFAGVVNLPPMADKFYLLIGVTPTPPAPPPPRIPKLGDEGVDVSRWQNDAAMQATGKPDINWAAIKASGRTFAYIRATLGATGRDAHFIRNWHGANDAGFLLGGYHLFVWNDNGKAQADNFLNALGTALGDLPLVMDLEPREVDKNPATPGYAPIDKARSLANALALLERLQSQTGKAPVIYTNNWALTLMVDNRFPLAKYPLFHASYPKTLPPASAPFPKPTPHWPSLLCWQYSRLGSIPGVAGNIDLDRWAV